MAISIDLLLAPLDKTAVLSDLYNLLGMLFGSPLTLDPGEPIPAVLDVVVGWAVDDLWNPFVLPALQAQFLDYASGDWLSLIAALKYNRPRIQALAGTQTVVFENRSLVPISQAAGQVRIKSTTSTTTYTLTTTLTIAAWSGSGAFPTGSGTVEADVVGSAGDAQPGDVPLYPTPLVAGPISVFVQSVAGPIQGSDQESDVQLVTRCRLAVSEVSDMGPRAEYLSVALDPVGAFTRRGLTPPSTWGAGLPAISRVWIVEPGDGSVFVYLASPSGPAAGSSTIQDSDVYKANVAIQNFVAPPGAVVTVAPAVARSIAVGTVIVYVDRAANVTVAQAQAQALAAIDLYFQTLNISGARTVAGGTGFVFANKIAAVAGAGPGVIDVVLVSFTDVALAADEVAVPDSSLVVVANLVTQTQ